MAIQARKFWDKVNARNTGNNGCWQWTAGKNKNGYGAFWVDKRAVGAHRVAWEIVHGPIPDDMCVVHACGDKGCVNPDHLELGSQINSRPGGQRLGAKLLAEDIPMIRAELGCGVTQKDIAKQYGVTKQTISAIHNNLIWKDVQ